ncbi:FadR/GntR family transcriptional regulator [Devosia limi]|nr:FadR/GntR family transcriptional regulator [Devosia limi]SHF83877.1 DNA-binding transcriptional regulator, FadR family [Devosia limi DSM 17137]
MARAVAKPAAARNLGKGKIATAVSVLGEKIVSGAFPPDTPLPVEADLANETGVGRSVLREAIKVLASKGMVSARPRIGTVILPREQWNLFDQDVLNWLLKTDAVTPELVRDILVARKIIEPEAARLAARHATDADKQAITSIYQAMVAAVDDPAAAVDADIRFHTAILGASHNMILTAFSPAITAILSAFFQISIQNPEVFPSNLAAHGKVAEHIAAGDQDAAYEAMHAVLAATEHDLTSRLKL